MSALTVALTVIGIVTLGIGVALIFAVRWLLGIDDWGRQGFSDFDDDP